MSPQRILNDRYEIGELIGRGGMADVYQGLDTRLGRRVAVKMMRPDLARDPQFQSRFRREAQSSAALNHPNIVAVFDTGEEELADTDHAGVACPFMVMEYVSGSTLRALLRAGQVTIDQAVEWTSGVLAAVAYSHSKDIVHRDIKPANVMVTDTGDIKVMDFGIARALSDSSATMTQTQAVVGTAQYLSPEQARGEQVDSRSDLYSVGCLLFELLTGRPPFVGDSPVAVAYQHVREEAPVPSTINPDIPAALDSVIAKALQKEREDRFSDGDEFLVALQAAHTHGTVVPPPNAADLSTETVDTTDTGQATTVLSATSAGTAEDTNYPTQALSAVSGSAREPDPFTPDPGGYSQQVDDVWGHQDENNVDQEDRKSNRRVIVIIIMVLVALGAVAGGWWIMNEIEQRNIEANQVTVPGVANMTQTEAQNALTAAGLRPIIEQVHHDDVARDHAIDTRPAEGDILQRYDEITLRISMGPDQVLLPEDLEGASEATVRDTLEELGLQISEVNYVDSATIERDRLVATSPALGSTVAYGSTVQLQMSSGQVRVPDLIGLTLKQAQEALAAEDIGLSLAPEDERKVDEEPSAGYGRIIEQTQEAGSAINQGSTINVVIAVKPPEPEPDPEPTDNETSDEPSDSDSPEPDPSPTDDESPPDEES